jgi:hypothetical protein
MKFEPWPLRGELNPDRYESIDDADTLHWFVGVDNPELPGAAGWE